MNLRTTETLVVPSGMITGVSMATYALSTRRGSLLDKKTKKRRVQMKSIIRINGTVMKTENAAIPVHMAKEDWPDEFLGYCIDSGATASVVGQKQFKAYEAMLGHKIPKKRGKKTFRFGSGKHKTYARFEARIPTPAGCYLTVPMSVVLIDIPFLFGLDVLKKYNLQLDFMHDKIKSRSPKWEMDLSYRGGHVFFSHNTSPASPYCIRRPNSQECISISCTRPAGKLVNLIRKANPEKADESVRKLIEQINKKCSVCSEHSVPPFRFRASIPPDEIIFNREVSIDLMWLDKKPILHIVDTATNFQNALFIRKKTAQDLWDDFVDCWASVYTGFPEIIRLDRRSFIHIWYVQRKCC